MLSWVIVAPRRTLTALQKQRGSIDRRHRLALDHQPQRLDELFALAALGTWDAICGHAFKCCRKRYQRPNGQIAVNGK